ncbi:MAG: endonuclease III domain-containing protein [Thermoproteus sp.]|nr:endonuclease III domain-containing protein [Thermoproteus sp.]
MECLRLTLYPSLVLALVEERGGKYVKAFGAWKGIDVASSPELSGDWYSPWRYVGDADGRLADAVHPLLEIYGDCLGLSISPRDAGLLFVVAFLTQNTSYHVNVLRWARALFSQSEDLGRIAEEAPRVGNSYQLRRLPAAVRAYLELRPAARRELMQIPGVGPKTADVYLLFTGDSTAAPVDKHFLRTASRLGLPGGPPRPELCRRYGDCSRCPFAARCLRAVAERGLGRLAGWVQTATYLYDKGISPRAFGEGASPRPSRI